MDVIVEEVYLEEIPVLLVHTKNSQKRSVLFLFHKLLNNKEQELPLAYELAKEEYFVILLDMYGHGKRAGSFDTAQRYEFNHLMKDIRSTAEDVKRILCNEAFIKRYGLKAISVKVIGVSIGSAIALHCFLYLKEVSAMASMIGTYDLRYIIGNRKLDSFKLYAASAPVLDYRQMEAERKILDLTQIFSKEHVKPVFFMDGKLDTTVPIEERRHFKDQLKGLYQSFGRGELVRQKDYNKAGHHVTLEMQKDLIVWLNAQWKGGI